jgi:hypothetical protein
MSYVDEAIDRILADKRMYQAECNSLRHELEAWKTEALEQSKLLASSLKRIEELLAENEKWRRLAVTRQDALRDLSI